MSFLLVALIACAAATDYCAFEASTGCSKCVASLFGCQWCAGECISAGQECATGADANCCGGLSLSDCGANSNCDWCFGQCGQKGCQFVPGTPVSITTGAPTVGPTYGTPGDTPADTPSWSPTRGCSSLDVFSCDDDPTCSYNSRLRQCQSKTGPCTQKDQLQCTNDGQPCTWDTWANKCGDPKACSLATSLSDCNGPGLSGFSCTWCGDKCTEFGDCANEGVDKVTNFIIIGASVGGGLLLVAGIIVVVIVCQNNKKKTNLMPSAVYVTQQNGATQQGVPPTFAPGNAAGVQQGAPPAAFRQPAAAPVVHQSPVPTVYRGPAQQI